MNASPKDRVVQALRAGHGAAVRRVYLIDEHTDYHDGFVLPIAIGGMP